MKKAENNIMNQNVIDKQKEKLSAPFGKDRIVCEK